MTARANNYGPERFNRPGFSVLTSTGELFVADFQGSRILHFQLPNLAASIGRGALAPARPFEKPADRPAKYREWFEFRSIENGVPALHVLGQKDFETGLRGVATRRQMGKETSGLDLNPDRRWLFIAEKLNHRVLVVDVSGDVETYMPAMAVLGQVDFDSNRPNRGLGKRWHLVGMAEPGGLAYDTPTRMLYVVGGEDGNSREILGFDLADGVINGMEPALRIGGPHSTVGTDLVRVGRSLAIASAAAPVPSPSTRAPGRSTRLTTPAIACCAFSQSSHSVRIHCG